LGRTCSTHKRDEKCVQSFCLENLNGWQDITKDLNSNVVGAVGWIHLARHRDRDQLLPAVNTVTWNFGFHSKW
jgi:hypothetical protein